MFLKFNLHCYKLLTSNMFVLYLLFTTNYMERKIWVFFFFTYQIYSKGYMSTEFEEFSKFYYMTLESFSIGVV